MAKDSDPPLTPELLLYAYSKGVFPMSEGATDDEVFWVDPTSRGILPLNGFHISRSLARAIRRGGFDIRINTDFQGVVQGCAEREVTWINAEIFSLYKMLHHMGFAHSLEVYQADALVGGVYGVALGGAFFGESMFSRQTDASKIALAFLVDRLKAGGFQLLDTQFLTAHLASLGGVEISRDVYQKRLQAALNAPADFLAQPSSAATGAGILQRNTQTS